MKHSPNAAILCIGLLFACGGSQTSTGSPDEGTSGDCNYSVDDSCMNADALAQCQSMAAQCPGQVQAMETCPLQFACPPETTSDTSTSNDSDTSVGESCEGYRIGDSCIDESNFAQCQQMAAQCPGQVQVMESCPLQFACP